MVGKGKYSEGKIVLSISILISNHYENVERCLNSIQPILQSIPSELILTDTGCDKEVRLLMEKYTDHIISFPWCKDFAAARNAGLKEAKGEWFLYLDDDEWFGDASDLIAFFNSKESDNYNVAFYKQRNYFDRQGTLFADHNVDRILRINPQLHFEHRVHEAYAGIEIGQKKALDSFVHHFGYVYDSEEERIQKYERNQELLERECKDFPNDMRMRYQLVINPTTIEDWEMSIRLAFQAIDVESDSEYWDACHTHILYCLNQEERWEDMVRYGEAFLKKNLYPYDNFGILQYLVTAYWKLAEFNRVLQTSNQALDQYVVYKHNPEIFNRNQLLRTEFVSTQKIDTMLAYGITAAKFLGDTAYLARISEKEMMEDFNRICHNEHLVEWIERANKTLSHATENNEMQNGAELVLPKEFFDGEEREGFYIQPFMKNAWAANMEILHQIDCICKEHNIPYFADWGTLLGAVRHQGYIPWDDDIDICMLRSDYKRFCQVIEEYQGQVELLNIYTAEDWGEHADKVINNSAFTVERAKIKECHGFPFTAGVDIFIIDYVPRDKDLEEEWLAVLRLISYVCHLRDDMEMLSPDGEEYLQMKKDEVDTIRQIREMTGVEFAQPNPTTQELMILKDEVSGLYGKEDADYMTQVACLGVGMDYYLPKDTYDDAVWMPFENMSVPVPKDYDLLLRKKYGDDYMTPINKGAGHDYPFYNKSIKELSVMKHQDEKDIRIFAEKIGSEYYYKFIHKSEKPEIDFSSEFFREEEIDGVIVGEDRKRIWAAQLEVYLEVKRLCDEHEIKLFAVGETLQGAMERNGYLPTSEDFHLAVMRNDYMKLMTILQEELDPWFDYRNVYSCREHEDMRCYVVTDGYLCDVGEYLVRFHGCPHIVGVDIAAIDGISSDQTKEDMRKAMIVNLLQTAKKMPANPPYSLEIRNIVEEWKELAQLDISLNDNLRREFVKAADIVAGSFRGECNKVRISAYIQEEEDRVYNKSWFHDTIEVNFETTVVTVPVGNKEILERDI
ncbi:MAG: LicD family protein [Lachnospiraceae bacterium]|nr:LicD family protein [Lachnospiraceae bacterium]